MKVSAAPMDGLVAPMDGSVAPMEASFAPLVRPSAPLDGPLARMEAPLARMDGPLAPMDGSFSSLDGGFDRGKRSNLRFRAGNEVSASASASEEQRPGATDEAGDAGLRYGGDFDRIAAAQWRALGEEIGVDDAVVVDVDVAVEIE